MAGVNVKMNVTGVSQFKTSMNEAKAAVKTLDAQMALNEKQFKATGDAEAYMQQKTELLQKKLEEQKSVVANAEAALKQMATQGVDQASKAYQNMQLALAKAKADLLDTEMSMTDVAESGDEVTTSVETMNHQLQKIGDGVSYQNVLNGLKTISDGITGVVKKAWQMGEALVKNTLGAGAWADELATTATQYDNTLRAMSGGQSTTEYLQRMRKTANLIDTDVDAILSSMDKMRQGIGKRDKEAMGAFAALFGEGYDPTVKSGIDAFWDAGEALMALDNEYDKQVYAQKLFGRSWRELVPLFTAGRKEYEQTMSSWNVIEDEQLDGLLKMDDQYQRLTGEWETFKTELLATFSGPLAEGMETITGLFAELNKYLDTPEGQKMLQQMGETVSGLISDLTNVDPESVISGLKGILDGIKDSLEWINDHSGEVKTGLEVIAGGFAAIKVAQLALNIASIVSGFKTLWGGAKNPLPKLTDTGISGGGSVSGAIENIVTSTAAKVAAGVAAGVAVLTQGMWDPNYVGNDDILDENGELTESAKEAGFYRDEGGLIQNTQTQPSFWDVTPPEEETVELSDDALLALNEWQRGAAEDYWDAMKAFGVDPEGYTQAWNQLSEAFQDEPAMMAQLISLIDSLGTNPENGIPDDLPSWWFGLEDSISKMDEAASDLIGDSGSRKQASSDLSAAAGSLQGVRGDISAGIKDGFSGVQIVIDGVSAGQALTPHIGGNLGNMIALVR